MNISFTQLNTFFSSFITEHCLHTFSELDSNVIVMQCKFNTDFFSDMYYNYLPFNEPLSIKNAVVKRRSEFLAGRIVAMSALENMGIVDRNVLIGDNRMPIFPADCVGSITHSSEKVIAIVSKKNHTQFVGIDCERKMSETFARNIATEILLDNELLIFNTLKLSFSMYCTIVFSVKESLFKALYPLVGIYFDFKDTELVEINPEITSFKIKVIRPLGNTYNIEGREFCGRIEICSDYITTIILSLCDGMGSSVG